MAIGYNHYKAMITLLEYVRIIALENKCAYVCWIQTHISTVRNCSIIIVWSLAKSPHALL